MTGVDDANAGCVKRWSGTPNESYIENFVSEDFRMSGPSVQNITKK